MFLELASNKTVKLWPACGMWCSRENVKSFLPSRNIYEMTEVLLQQVKKIHELFSRVAYLFIVSSACCWMFNTEQCHQWLVVCKHHHLQNIRENIGVGRDGCSFIQASPWQPVLLRVDRWDLQREDSMTDPGRIRSLYRHICVQLPKAHTLGACSEASHNQQAVHIVFGPDPRDSWRLLLPHAYKAPFPFPVKPASS